jgi:cytochrome c oxidase subunit III
MKRVDATPEVEPQPSLGGGGADRLPPPPGYDGDERRKPEGNPRLRRRLLRARVGLGAGAVGISIFFLAIASAYLVRQGTPAGTDRFGNPIGEWKTLVLPQIIWLNTLLLLVSSFTVELARRQMFHEPALMQEWLGIGRPTQRRALPWMGITLILGFAFLGGQYLAWMQMNILGWFVQTNPSSAFFFILTGAHALHLLGGLIALGWAAFSTARGRPMESRQVATDISAWYWHLMGGIWLGIVGLMYFAQ